jgi:hypothetical protein
VRGDEVDERVAAMLLARGTGELERDRGLGHDGERLDGRSVRALDEGFRGLACAEVHRPQGSHERGQRLHRRAHEDLLAVRHASLDAARAIRLTVDTPTVARDLVVSLRTAQAREREPVPDLHSLDGLDAHEGPR